MAILDTRERDAQTPNPSPVPGKHAWVFLGMLCFVYVLNFVDRPATDLRVAWGGAR